MRTRRLLGGLSAAILLAVLLIGVPLLLVGGLGNPLPEWSTLRSGDISDETVLKLLGCVLWIAWAQWVPGTWLEVSAGIADARAQDSAHPHWLAHKPRHISAGQGLSRALVTAIVGLAIAAPISSGTARAWSAPTPMGPGASPATVVNYASAHPNDNSDGNGVDRAPFATASADPPSDDAATSKRHPVFVVGSDATVGPSLWSIAQHTLGDPLRWREIWALNRDRQMSDGATFTNPDLIQDGWQLALPADATAPSFAGLAAPGSEITVGSGDTIDEIAGDRLHVDPQLLVDANLGRSEPGGRVFDDPNLILPGWKLTVPTAAAIAPAHFGSDQPHAPGRPQTRSTHVGHTRPGGTTTSISPTVPPDSSPTKPPSRPTATGPAHTAEPAHNGAARYRSSSDMPMVAFVGGGALLAGASLTALIAYRRRQFRLRRPGNMISASPPELLRAERTLLSVGGPAMLDVRWLDQALRGLVHGRNDGSDPDELAARFPDVVAVRLANDELELVLANAQPNAPAPWRVDDTGLRWSMSRGEDCGYDPVRRAYHFAPFPMLASVGYAEDGSQWLLDLERLASLSLAGDQNRCLDLARFLACELAHNTWSEMLQVTLVGFGQELVAANPDRLSYTTDLNAAIAEIHQQIDAVNGAADGDGPNVLAARIGFRAGETWAPHVLLIAPSAAVDRNRLDRLLSTLRGHRSRIAVSVVLADRPGYADATSWQLTVNASGTLHIPGLDLHLTAQQMPSDEAAEVAHLLALSATEADLPMPRSQEQRPWDRYADAAGALRLPDEQDAETTALDGGGTASEQYGVAPTSDGGSADAASQSVESVFSGPGRGPADVPALHMAGSSLRTISSVLPLPEAAYLERAATTAEDLAVLAPQTDDVIRKTVEATVGELDADLAEWYDASTVRPRVSLLGPVRVRAQGPLPQRNPRIEWHTEIVAYLVTRPSGVSSEEYGTALWPNDPDVTGKSKVRQSVMIVRKWLGRNPNNGREFLPPAMTPGYASYRIEDALVDAELFRRLRLRGLARGEEGIEDLWAALKLVTGEPFSERRKEGYAWLADVPLHHIYSAMIVDVAHTVATHHLGAREAERAAEAAQIALDAGSTEDVPLLDKVAACDAQDLRAEADALVKRILSNHDAEIEEDLPPRTAEVLMRRQWIGNAS